MLKIIAQEKLDNEVISLQEAKEYLRVTTDEDDALIISMLNSAIEYTEKYIGEFLIYRKITAEYSYKNEREIKLPHPNIIELEDFAGLTSGEDYKLLANRILLLKKPSLQNFNLTYIAGIRDVALLVKHGILHHLSLLYDKEQINSSSLETIHIFYKPYRRIRL